MYCVIHILKFLSRWTKNENTKSNNITLAENFSKSIKEVLRNIRNLDSDGDGGRPQSKKIVTDFLDFQTKTQHRYPKRGRGGGVKGSQHRIHFLPYFNPVNPSNLAHPCQSFPSLQILQIMPILPMLKAARRNLWGICICNVIHIL